MRPQKIIKNLQKLYAQKKLLFSLLIWNCEKMFAVAVHKERSLSKIAPVGTVF